MCTEQQVRFELGQTVATPTALEALRRSNATGFGYLRRHASGDWGIVSDEDREANEQALRTGARILSVYHLPDETTLWIVTDAIDDSGQRQATTLLLPEEY